MICFFLLVWRRKTINKAIQQSQSALSEAVQYFLFNCYSHIYPTEKIISCFPIFRILILLLLQTSFYFYHHVLTLLLFIYLPSNLSLFFFLFNSPLSWRCSRPWHAPLAFRPSIRELPFSQLVTFKPWSVSGLHAILKDSSDPNTHTHTQTEGQFSIKFYKIERWNNISIKVLIWIQTTNPWDNYFCESWIASIETYFIFCNCAYWYLHTNWTESCYLVNFTISYQIFKQAIFVFTLTDLWPLI